MISANLAPEFFFLDSLVSKDVSCRDLYPIKKETWDILWNVRKVQNIDISDKAILKFRTVFDL